MDSENTLRITRREFLTITGVAVAGLAVGCKQPQGTQAPSNTSKFPTATILPAPAGSPDMILRNGKVITMDTADSIIQAVAVKDGSIQAVGSNEAIDALKDPETQVIELAGRVLTPGLIDPHLHLQIWGTLDMIYIPFLPPEVNNIPDMQKKLAEVVAQTPPGEWIQGYYYRLDELRLPTGQELDLVSPNNPVFMVQQGGHLAAINNQALQMANITADTPDPTGGTIIRDKNGNPTGELYGHHAMDLVRKVIPQRPPELAREGIRKPQPLLVTTGVTSFSDVYVRGLENVQAYREAGEAGDMIVRGAVYPILEYPKDLEGALKLEPFNSPFMRLGGFKLQIDGQAPTAYCHEPHDGITWDKPYWEPEAFKRTVCALHDAGHQICVHAIGDAGVDLVLDAYEAAMNANPRPDPRHRIEHCVLTTPEATQRIRDLGVIVSDTSSFIHMAGDYWVKLFGKKRIQRLLVTREWLDAGIHLALNSDYPTTLGYAPQMNMAVAMERRTAHNNVINEDQKITVQEALRAHTIGAAYAGFEEGIKGSIEPGKLADLAVWTNDPYSVSAEELAAMTMDMTIVGGKIIYQAT